MAERCPRNGAAANGFGRRSLQEWEAYALHEANCPTPPDMRVRGAWRLSAGGVPMPPSPSASERRDEIARISASLSKEARYEMRYTPNNTSFSTAYFTRRHEEQLASTNGFPVTRGRHNSDG
ncbi:hypothetical protein D1007_01675 [Hordeum vulgare]|nr:hypothetical protein D1007_01675 [Hordeum vulgare]